MSFIEIVPPGLSGVGPWITIFVEPGAGSGRPFSFTSSTVSQRSRPSLPMFCQHALSAWTTPNSTTGSQVRMRNVRRAGVESTLPTASVARTSKVCSPPSSLSGR